MEKPRKKGDIWRNQGKKAIWRNQGKKAIFGETKAKTQYGETKTNLVYYKVFMHSTPRAIASSAITTHTIIVLLVFGYLSKKKPEEDVFMENLCKNKKKNSVVYIRTIVNNKPKFFCY